MIVDTDLARRLDGVADDFTVAWLDAIAARPGNPRRLSFLRWPDVLAPASEQLPSLELLNHVVGLHPDRIDRVPEIVRWYRHKGIWPWFDVAPGPGSDRLLDALAAEGAWPIGFSGTLVGVVKLTSVPIVGDVRIETVDEATIGEFADTLVAGHDTDGQPDDDAAADVQPWLARPGTYLLTARIQGLPAGCAAVYVRDGIALLADAAVRAEARGRGVYHALVGARLQLARHLGCELVSARASFGTPVHRYLQQVGLASGYTRAVLRLGG
jgi:GNAT superfamily N-acetyltransferase